MLCMQRLSLLRCGLRNHARQGVTAMMLDWASTLLHSPCWCPCLQAHRLHCHLHHHYCHQRLGLRHAPHASTSNFATAADVADQGCLCRPVCRRCVDGVGLVMNSHTLKCQPSLLRAERFNFQDIEVLGVEVSSQGHTRGRCEMRTSWAGAHVTNLQACLNWTPGTPGRPASLSPCSSAPACPP